MEGIFKHTLDAKGRLAIPSRLKDDLGKVFYVTISTEKCLSAYSLETWDGFKEKLRSMPIRDQKKLRPLFSHAAKCEMDAQNRILIPQTLREMKGLSKNVTVVGNGVNVEFWDAEAWEIQNEAETTEDNLDAAFEELDF